MVAPVTVIAVYLTVSIALGDRRLAFDKLHLWRIDDGLLVGMRAVPIDPYAVDEFFETAGVTSPG